MSDKVSDIPPQPPRTRLAAVSFLNSKPILHGLNTRDDVSLILDVPSKLIDYLIPPNGLVASVTVHAALLPVIDYHRLDHASLLPVSGIGCDGPTLTVRIFSDRPFGQINELAVDGDSHTSVVLAQVILQMVYKVRPVLTPLSTATTGPRLLIGDKVITAAPSDMPYQLDLGEAWKQLTGMPFLFAGWFVRPDGPIGHITELLERAAVHGLANREQIVQEYAPKMGWPIGTARKYVFDYLRYRVGPEQIKAVTEFYRLAAQLGLISNPQALRVISTAV